MQWWKRIDQAGGTALHRDVLFDRPRFADRHPPVRSPRDPLPPAQGVSRVCQDSGRPRLHPHLALPPHPRFDGDRSLEVSTLLQRPRPNNGLRHVQEPSGIFHSLLGNTSFGLTPPEFSSQAVGQLGRRYRDSLVLAHVAEAHLLLRLDLLELRECIIFLSLLILPNAVADLFSISISFSNRQSDSSFRERRWQMRYIILDYRFLNPMWLWQ